MYVYVYTLAHTHIYISMIKALKFLKYVKCVYSYSLLSKVREFYALYRPLKIL